MKDLLEVISAILVVSFILIMVFIFVGEPDLWDKWHNTLMQ